MNTHSIIASITLVASLLMPDKSLVSQGALYQRQDSIKIVNLLRQAALQKQKPKSWMLWFGKQFVGVPYVAGTLDRTKEEVLVVNTRELDCTTYVEMVTALSMCASRRETSFSAFCNHLKHVRYIGGEISYVKRQHYFTVWIDDNEHEGIVKNVAPNPPFTALQTVNVDWMSTHTKNYKMLSAHPQWARGIRQLEQNVNGKRYRYIPKSRIANTSLMRQSIHDGDIIAIITNKKGLDTTHIGMASWHKDGLHLLNASSIHKKVIDEPMTLYQYMQKHPVQVGIRVCRVL
ncbi:MAG TPA: DUF1460 domain-containing protein [Prevotella sp.]|nr:DUF1460 domain-containing protein [Candidatus Segatella violae]